MPAELLGPGAPVREREGGMSNDPRRALPRPDDALSCGVRGEKDPAEALPVVTRDGGRIAARALPVPVPLVALFDENIDRRLLN